MDYPVIEPDEKKIDQLVSGIQTKLGLELLGIDIIIENGTGRYGVIDANAFPGRLAAALLAVLLFSAWFTLAVMLCGSCKAGQLAYDAAFCYQCSLVCTSVGRNPRYRVLDGGPDTRAEGAFFGYLQAWYKL